MKLKKLLTLLSLLALMMTACGGDTADTTDTGEAGDTAETEETEDPADAGADDTGGESVTVETLDNEFQPSEFEVPAGEIEITLDNTGQAPHTFTSEELGVDQEVAPGEQVTFTVDAEPGTYPFVCSFHEELGMTGTMTVTE